MVDSPYDLDFFSRVVDLHFGGPGILAIHIVAGVTADHPPNASVSIGGSLLTKREKFVRRNVPAHDIPQPRFFAWMGGAPLPTIDTFGIIVGTATYATQFSKLIDVNSSGFLSPQSLGLTLASSSGLYPTLEAAQAYAAEFNARFAGGGAGQTITYFSSGSGLTTTGLSGMSAVELDLPPIHVPAQFGIQLTGDYTLKLGSAPKTTTVTVSVDPTPFSTVTLEAAFDSAGGFGGGVGTYQIATGVVSGNDRCVVTSPS